MRSSLKAAAAAITALILLTLVPIAKADTQVQIIAAELKSYANETKLSAKAGFVVPLKQFRLKVQIPRDYVGWLVVPIPPELAEDFISNGVWIPGYNATTLYIPEYNYVDLWIYGNWSKGVVEIKGYIGPPGNATPYSLVMLARPLVGGIRERDLIILPLYLIENPHIVIEEHTTDTPNWLLNIPASGAWRMAVWIPSVSHGDIISKLGEDGSGWALYFDVYNMTYHFKAANKLYPVIAFKLACEALRCQIPVNIVNLKVYHIKDVVEGQLRGEWIQLQPPPYPNTEPVTVNFFGYMHVLWIVSGDFNWPDTLVLLVPGPRGVEALSPILNLTVTARSRTVFVGLRPEYWALLSGPIVKEFLKPELRGYIAVYAAPSSLIWLVDDTGRRRGAYTSDGVLALINIENFEPRQLLWVFLPSKEQIAVATVIEAEAKPAYILYAAVAAGVAAFAALYVLRRRR